MSPLFVQTRQFVHLAVCKREPLQECVPEQNNHNLFII